MAEAWLKTNRRALVLGMVVPGVALVTAVAALVWAITSGQHWLIQLPLVVVAVVPLWMLGELVYAVFHPRVGYEAGELLVFLEPTRPTRVPIDIVEVFFLGQGLSPLPKLQGREPETQNVIIRLAESAAQWKQRDVKPAFGQWCEGYITLRGGWCEPITPGVVKRLNQLLAQVQSERKQAEGEANREAERERNTR
jgi:hypothetical protein